MAKAQAVTTSYDISQWPAMDDAIEAAVGRVSDFAGAGIDGRRDHGWVCKSEIEVERVKRALRGIGLRAEVRTVTVEPVDE